MSDKTYQRMSIQQAIEAIKRDTGVTNYRLSKVLGVQQTMIKRYINGETKSVNVKAAKKLYDVYGILVDSFNNIQELNLCHQSSL